MRMREKQGEGAGGCRRRAASCAWRRRGRGKLLPADLDLLAMSAHQHAKVLDHVGELVEATVLAEHSCCVTHQHSRKTATKDWQEHMKVSMCARVEKMKGTHTHTRAYSHTCARA